MSNSRIDNSLTTTRGLLFPLYSFKKSRMGTMVGYDYKVLLYECTEPPSGYLQVLCLVVLPLCASYTPVIFDHNIYTEDMLQDAKTTYNNFVKECQTQQYNNIEYLQHVIGEIIAVQETAVDTTLTVAVQDDGESPCDKNLHIVIGHTGTDCINGVICSNTIVSDHLHHVGLIGQILTSKIKLEGTLSISPQSLTLLAQTESRWLYLMLINFRILLRELRRLEFPITGKLDFSL